MRRLLIIVVSVIVLAGGAAAYYYFFANTPSVAVAPPGSAGLPTAGNASSTAASGGFGIASSTPSAPVSVSARLVEISAGPVVAGEAVTDASSTPASPATGVASSTAGAAVHYIERESGNVYTYLAATGASTRTSNKTVPGIESATWLSNASLAFVRYLSGNDFSIINTYGLPADGAGGFFLPQGIVDIAASGSNILTLASGVNGSVASFERADGTHALQAFSTPLTALRVSFAGKGKYLAFTKPSASLAGDAFLVNGAGQFSRIAGPLNGLVALASPSGAWVLVSYSQNGIMYMELVNMSDGTTTPLPISTIADKCVWTADSTAVYCGVPENPPTDAQYPDDWYQGVIHFSDRIWKIDVAGRYAQMVLDFPKEANSMLDATALAIDPAKTALVFMNKNDDSLWLYRL
ncbi:MAG TPA: hypothetical protein VMV50_02390 [Candidatus Paceibacterota bacterium]|nr:hypothetical protein [Candidatus Paceibacterota bacterium]